MASGRSSAGGGGLVLLLVLAVLIGANPGMLGSVLDRLTGGALGALNAPAGGNGTTTAPGSGTGSIGGVSTVPLAPLGATQPATGTVTAARTALEKLPFTAAKPYHAGYTRAAFGKAWTDTDKNGCNTRDDVLARDHDPAAPYRAQQQGTCAHDVIAGTWTDPYTGQTVAFTNLKDTTQSTALQIDHLVSLETAWRDGAYAWTDSQRLTFANDLTELAAVTAATNTSKSGSDASGWRPKAAYQCTFAVRYITIKDSYRLQVHTTEKAALTSMLNTCTG